MYLCSEYLALQKLASHLRDCDRKPFYFIPGCALSADMDCDENEAKARPILFVLYCYSNLERRFMCIPVFYVRLTPFSFFGGRQCSLIRESHHHHRSMSLSQGNRLSPLFVIYPFSRLLQLFLPEKLKEAHANNPLQQQRDPKRRFAQPLRPKHQIRKHRPGPILIWRRRPSHDCGDTAQHLRADECEDDVEAC